MQDIYNYILDQKGICDCHAHIFGRDGILDYPEKVSTIIAFVTNSLKYKDDDLLPYFEEFIKKQNLNCNRWFLGGIGKDINETDELFSKLGKNINCIGEIKCYKHYKDSDNVEHTHYDTKLLKHVVKHYSLPIFIHWDLDGTHDAELYDIIKSNPQLKFVLCHCGINDLDCPEKAFNTAIEFQTKLPNLWLEISWVALDYIVADTKRLPKIEIMDHTLVGTDFSQDDKYTGIDNKKLYSNFRKLCSKFNLNQSIRELFM